METYVGQIILSAWSGIPNGWVPCDGRLLPVNQYQALFALIGFTYGGDGRTTFAVPDLRGRVPVAFGTQTSATSAYTLGQKGGVEGVTLTASQMPLHSHAVQVDASGGSTTAPQGNNLALVENPVGDTPFNSFTTGNPTTPAQLSPATIIPAGGNVAHENRQPYLAVGFFIAVEGLYPDFNS